MEQLQPAQPPRDEFGFSVGARLDGALGRTGTIRTPHGVIDTPAFIAVGTKATVKSVLPESMADLQAQAVLANAYHLYLQPGPDIVEQGGGLGRFMNWPGPTFTDSGGFQVLSLGAGFKKVLAMNVDGMRSDDVIAPGKNRLAVVDDDGVTFKSHLDGSMHRFSPEISMRIQHQLGADIIFAFDECTTLMNTRIYQERSVVRTQEWAVRCLTEHRRLTADRAGRPYQALFAVVQGAQYEDLRRQATRDLVALDASTGTDGDSTGTASAAPWRSRTWGRSSGGSARNYRRTGRGICWASANPTTCSPPSRTARTPSIVCRRRGSPGTARSTRPAVGTT